MITNLRGTSGSGKSTVGHYLVDTYKGEEIYEDGWNKTKPRLVGYKLPGGLTVLGSYRAAGGGADTFSPRDQLPQLIRNHAEQAEHIFFEALVISSTVPKYVDLADELKFTNPFVFAFLDTPVDLCIQNVYTRNGGKPIKEDNIRGHHRYMTRVAQRLRDAHQSVVAIDHTDAFAQVEQLMRNGGWQPE